MESFDLAVAWTWPPDAEFVGLIEAAAHEQRVSFLRIEARNVRQIQHALEVGGVRVRRILDRASDENDAFAPLARWIQSHASAEDPSAPRPINSHELMLRAADKATMHLEFLSAGLSVPHSVILPPAASHPGAVLPAEEFDRLGVPFVVKPANTTGGGNGVVLDVRTAAEVAVLQRTHPGDKYLVQELIRPAYLGDYRAWFRVFYVCGDTHLCWWDDRTHVYEEVSPDDERFFGLDVLRRTTMTIAGICGLDFFSTELVQTQDGRVVAVDYVNEMCDMRLQTTVPTGVPSPVVRRIAGQLVKSSVTGNTPQGVSP